MGESSHPVTLFTGQWADLPFEEVARARRGLGLRRPRDRLLRATTSTSSAPTRTTPTCAAGSTSSSGTASGLRHLEPPHGPGRLRRPDRLPAPGDRAAEHVGRRRARGRAAARGRGHEAGGQGRPEAGRRHGRRVHRLEDLAVRRDVPAGARSRHRRRLRGLRRPLEPHPRRLRRRGRAVRPRGAPLRDRLRLLDERPRPRGDRAPRGLRLQLGPVAHDVAGHRPGRLHRRLRRPDLPRRLQGHAGAAEQRPRRRARLAPALGRPASRLGLRLDRARRRRRGRTAFRALDAVGYAGPISIEWEDAGMDRLHGAPEALAHIRSLLWDRPTASFDAAFSNQ